MNCHLHFEIIDRYKQRGKYAYRGKELKTCNLWQSGWVNYLLRSTHPFFYSTDMNRHSLYQEQCEVLRILNLIAFLSSSLQLHGGDRQVKIY